MKRLRQVAVVVALLAIIGAPLAYAAGLWFGLPVVGGAAYCSGSSVAGVPGTTPVCNSTAPAGPTSMTGQELLPADLNPGGTQVGYPGPGAGVTAAAQTGYMPLANAASGAYQIVVPPTGAISSTLSVLNGINNVIANVTGTQTYVAFQMPATPTDGQLIRFAASATITTVAFLTGATAQSVQTTTKPNTFVPSNGATGPTGTFGATYLWSAPITTWLRIQ